MGTIVARQRNNGAKSYMARIILKRDNKIIHRESKTFTEHKAAVRWMKQREVDLAKPGALLSPTSTLTLADAIDRYVREVTHDIGKTKAQVLRSIGRMKIAKIQCDQIGSAEIVDMCRTLSKTMAPQTVGNYLSHLSAVFAIANPAWGIPLDATAMKAAQTVLKRLGLTSKSLSRDRRPSLAEIRLIVDWFRSRSERVPHCVPMAEIVMFAIFSTRRQEEITRIRWDDLDGDRILVRDMKHPGQKIGNHQWVDLPAEARAIIDRMPRKDARIFPYSTDAISAAFTRVCHMLGIEDLRFHDLRHEGVSRLFEMGLNIPHVAAVSGHRSWQSLKRYTHMRQSGDKWAGWS